MPDDPDMPRRPPPRPPARRKRARLVEKVASKKADTKAKGKAEGDSTADTAGAGRPGRPWDSPRDIALILVANCVGCHSGDGARPALGASST